MKTTFLLLFVLLFTTSSIASFCSAAEKPDPVIDTDGNMLRVGSAYFVIPLVNGSAGGVILYLTGNATCPFDVVQYPDAWFTGQPVSFSPVNAREGHHPVQVSTDLNVFWPNAYTTCPQYSTVWMLDKYDSSAKTYFLTTGGVQGNPGPATIRDWFKIEQFGKGYKFVYCPSVCSECKVICKDIGIVVQNGFRRLALSDMPYAFIFQKYS